MRPISNVLFEVKDDVYKSLQKREAFKTEKWKGNAEERRRSKISGNGKYVCWNWKKKANMNRFSILNKI